LSFLQSPKREHNSRPAVKHSLNTTIGAKDDASSGMLNITMPHESNAVPICKVVGAMTVGKSVPSDHQGLQARDRIRPVQISVVHTTVTEFE
jgi:hypothetical protein